MSRYELASMYGESRWAVSRGSARARLLTQLPGSAVVILSYHPGLDADLHPDPEKSFAKP